MPLLLLIDKSALQMLTMDEVRALCKHYDVLICPTLVDEIIANLLKGTERPSEETIRRVCDLAYKARGIGCRTIGRYEAIAAYDLIYGGIRMRPQIPRFDGTPYIGPDGDKGFYYEQSFEDWLLTRWSQGVFADEDLKMAREHIAMKELDFSKLKEGLLQEFPNFPKCKSLDEIAKLVFASDKTAINPWKAIEFYATILNVVIFEYPKLQKRWWSLGNPRFSRFAPYAYYCDRLLWLFTWGSMSGLISTSKSQKTWIDYHYFYYLPFCNVFCSNDDFQLSFSKYFLRKDQTVIKGATLKKDLGNIAQYTAKWTKEERIEYDKKYGSYPPPVEDSITNKLWEEFFGPRREGAFGNRAYTMSKEENDRIVSRVNAIVKGVKGDGGQTHDNVL